MLGRTVKQGAPGDRLPLPTTQDGAGLAPEGFEATRKVLASDEAGGLFHLQAREDPRIRWKGSQAPADPLPSGNPTKVLAPEVDVAFGVDETHHRRQE